MMASHPHSNVVCPPTSRAKCVRMEIIHGPLKRLRLRPEQGRVGDHQADSRSPRAVGDHACGCSHPEMRLLPNGIYRCPACGSEILPSELT